MIKDIWKVYVTLFIVGSGGGTLVKNSKKYVGKNIGCNILVVE
jgi:hypothetical protein